MCFSFSGEGLTAHTPLIRGCCSLRAHISGLGFDPRSIGLFCILHLGVVLVFVLYYFIFLFTKLEISEPWTPWIKKMFSHSSLHGEGYRSGVQVSPLEVASDVLFGQVDASGLPSGHLGQSRSARGIVMGNAGGGGEGLNWSTHPSWVSG